jgi:hypothetical protein
MSSTDEPPRIDYQPPATWESDLQVLRSMIFADVQGATQVTTYYFVLFKQFILKFYIYLICNIVYL